jgi:hypothetical protein
MSSTRAIDWGQVRALLKAYGAMSKRGKVAMAYRRKGTPQRWGLWLMLALYAFFGLMLVPLAAVTDLFTFALVAHGMTFFMLGLTLTSESGELLFNPVERDVLGHRPLGARTLLVAKCLNFLRLALQLTLALNLFPALGTLLAEDSRAWSPLAHLVAAGLQAGLAVALVVFAYLVLVRVAGRERFDSWSSWIQVAMSVTFFMGYQLLVALPEQLGALHISPASPLLLAIPPGWAAAVTSLLSADLLFGAALPLTLMGAAVGVAVSYLALGRLAGGYEELARPGATAPAAPRAPGRLGPLLRLWLRDPVERGAFQLTRAHLTRDRSTRVRLFPSLAIYVLFPLIGVLQSGSHLGLMYPLMGAWLLSTLPVTALMALRLSERPEAAELFAAAPLSSNGPLFHGVRKAVLAYLYLPIALVAMAITGACFGLETVMLALPALLLGPALSRLPGLAGYVPFSMEPTQGQQAGQTVAMVWASMFVGAAAVGLTWLADYLGFFHALLALGLVAALVCAWLMDTLLQQVPLPLEVS